MIFGLTGEKGSGKTWVCEQLATRLPIENLFGFYSPAVFEDTVKTGIELVLLPQGRRLPFARLAYPDCELRIGRWCMRPEAFTEVEAHLQQPNEARLFIADELGPFELEEGKGWVSVLSLLDSGRFPASIVTFRPGLRSLLQARWPAMKVLDVSNRAAQAQALDALLTAFSGLFQ